MESIGKFHGLSMVLKERGALDEQTNPPFFARENPGLEAVQMKSINNLTGTIKNTWGPEW